ncbi:hypothetical protein CI109_102157 [Kwoniella shandongensis]|uniref:Uncharacterized protein n=1 Tax=Kwoniella shandongensis TaxID=1734106 RepID=A0A5M6C4C2_9TREE|nr:uncharacterized protein CI109_003684 [Kwoniella shandongensis]KAA5528029.1 hypothetical protein CI109_003684 [Kwoniella shandongensis]
MKTTILLTIAALASSAVATPVLLSKRWSYGHIAGLDYSILNLARNLESLELAYWNQGLDNFTEADFEAAGYPGFRTYLELFRDQEIAHFTVLNDALGGGFTNCTYTFPVTTPEMLLAMGQVVTTVGEGAFIGGVANLTDSPSRQTGGSILGNEARQNSLLRQFLGLNFFNAVNFDTPLTASQAYSLAAPFFDCPSSNPPIEFHLIPPILANFTAGTPPHNAGDEITVKWDTKKVNLGDDVHIQFLGDVYSIKAPLTQTGPGVGTTNLPEYINGTSILVATNFNGKGPIPDGQNFGIGYVVVA